MADDPSNWTKFGRYALLQKIGSGGMAEIYRAKTFGAAGFEKEFAIKLILPSLVDDSEFVEMFINEAKLAVNLYHANIVQVFDLGELDEQYYIAMEYVHGKDLLDVLARCAELNIKIPLDLVLFIAMETLKGLDFAHRAKDPYGEPLNIIHRDVSPSNIMISYAGDVKIGDFGVAKAAIERTLTESGTLKGKVGYMSPEQVMGNEIDARSDLFAASIVLFEALSMNRLFIGDSDLDVMLKVRDADIADSLRNAQPIPGDLGDILQRGLTKHREERFQTAGEFYQALVDFCFQHSIKVTGSDLSSFMRRLFAEEIEEEKEQRRSEPGGEALSREMARVENGETSEASQSISSSSSTPSAASKPSQAAVMTDDSSQASSNPAEAPETPSSMSVQDTARVEQPDHGAEGVEQQGGDETSDDNQGRYRYRDDSGLVFGPMGADTLVDLLRVRRPRSEDRISVDNGEWKPLQDVQELALDEELELPDRRSKPRPRIQQQAESQPRDSAGQRPPGPGKDDGDTDVMRRRPGAMEAETSSDEGAQPAGVLKKASSPVDDAGDEPSSQSPDPGDPPQQSQSLDGPDSPVATPAPDTGTHPDPSDTIQELKDQYASYEGELGNVAVARILARLHLAGATGRLVMERDEIEKSIYFRDGEPIFIESNRQEELLGRFLRSRNVISEDELDEALRRLDEWGGRLGDALVAIGAIPAHELFEYLSGQMREKLLEIFSWRSGYYGYYENQEPDTPGYSLGLDTYDTIVEGCRERVSIDHIRGVYENRSFVSIYRNEPPAFEIDRLGLRTRELRVINELDSGDTLEALLEKFGPEHHETVYRTIYLLHQVEIVSFEVTGKVDLPPLPDR